MSSPLEYRLAVKLEEFGDKMRSDVLGPSELEGTDYLLSSTMRLEDSFLQILGKCL